MLKKFKNASPAVKASMALLFANMVLKGLSMISGPIFTRIMSTSEYGTVSTFASWQSMLAVIITLNLTSGVFNNGMLEFREDRNVFQFSLLVVSSLSALFYFGIYKAFSDELNRLFDLPPVLIYCMFAYFFFVPAYQYWSGRQRYEYKYKLLTTIIIASSIFTIIAGVLAVINVENEKQAVAKILASEMINIGVGITFYVIIGMKARFKCNIKYCLYALKFNLPLLPHYLSMYVLGSSDRIMISKMVNTSATAIYSVSYTVGLIINIVWQSIEASLSPWIYEKLSCKNYKEIKKITLQIILLFGAMCITCNLFSPEIMKILAPKEYYSGIYVIPSVSSGVFFTAAYSLYMRIELYYKKTGFATIATTSSALANIILNTIFIKRFSFYAAGYTTLFCYLLLYVLHYLNVKIKGYSHVLDNRGIAIISASVIVLTILVSLLYKTTFLRYALILCIGIVAWMCRKKFAGILKYK